LFEGGEVAPKEINLAGKDWFTVPEAAHYCGVSVSQFDQSTDELQAAGVRPRRVLGKKLYARFELARMIEGAPLWGPLQRSRVAFQSAPPARPPQSFPNLAPVRLRPYKPRKTLPP